MLVMAVATSLFAGSFAQADVTTRPRPAGNTFRVVTANLRQLLGGDTEPSATENSWDRRKDICCDVLSAQNADIYCFQEFRTAQMNYIAAKMPGFLFYALPQVANPGNAIMFSSARFEMLGGDGFWLSETPYKPGSKSWNSDAVRYTNWVRLKDKITGRIFNVWNLHLDHVSQAARDHQVAIALQSAAKHSDDAPQLLFGDFNAGPTNTVYSAVMAAGWRDSYAEGGGENAPNPGRTAHGFNPTAGGNKIDFIFMHGAFKATRAEVIKDYAVVDGVTRYPSDHFFISADVEFDTSMPVVDPLEYTFVSPAALSAPAGMSLDANGDLYVADESLNIIKRIRGIGSASSAISTYAGISGGRGFLDGNSDWAMFAAPRSLVRQDGIWYVADSGNRVLRVIKDATKIVSLYVGSTSLTALPADGTTQTAVFGEPTSIKMTRSGIIYVADARAHAIRRIETDGSVVTVAGALGVHGAADGTGTSARFNEPVGIALDADENNLYVADTGNNAIRKIALNGGDYAVSTVAGTPGAPAGSADGTGSAAEFNVPSDLAVVGTKLYVADTGNHTIRTIDLGSNAVTRVAGTPGVQTPVGMSTIRDGGPDEALFSYPSGIIAGANGLIYIADTGNSTIRFLDPSNGNKVSTPLSVEVPALSGTASPSDNPAGPASGNKTLGGPGGGAISWWGMLALALLGATRIRRKQ